MQASFVGEVKSQRARALTGLLTLKISGQLEIKDRAGNLQAGFFVGEGKRQRARALMGLLRLKISGQLKSKDSRAGNRPILLQNVVNVQPAIHESVHTRG